MTKEEAIKAMERQLKVTHYLFTDEEFLTYNNKNQMIDELGVIVNKREFWKIRDKKGLFYDGWSLFTEN